MSVPRAVVAGAVGLALMFPAPVPRLAGQEPGLPTFHRFTTHGLGVAVDHGLGAAGVPTDFDSWGVTATFGFGRPIDSTKTARLFSIGASLSRFVPNGGLRMTAWGLQAGVLFDLVHIGFTRWDSAGAIRWRAPVAISTGLLGCFSDAALFTFWGGARMDIEHRSRAGSPSLTVARPGFVLGLHAELRSGLGVQVAADQPRVVGKHSWIFGAGVHFSFHSLPRAGFGMAGEPRCLIIGAPE